MEYQKIVHLLDDTTNQSSKKLRTRNWVEINDESKVKHDNSNIRFKTSMIRSNLCHYNNACILVKGNIAVPNTAAVDAAVSNINKKKYLKILFHLLNA